MQFSRQSPSPRYLELTSLYQHLHVEGEKNIGLPPEQTFPGKSLLPHIHRIKKLIDKYDVKTLLDYGSGKGIQYKSSALTPSGGMLNAENYMNPDNITIQQFWGLKKLQCYDPAYKPFMTLPDESFDMVVSTDVLEHCPEEDMSWILDEMFGYANKCLFANVACFPANKTLPNGENAHCTIQPMEWWHELLNDISNRHPQIMFEFLVTFDQMNDIGESNRVTANLTNIPA